MKSTQPTIVSLESWFSPIWGTRYSIVHEGRTLQVCATELEARRSCRAHEWTIDEEPWLGAPELARPERVLIYGSRTWRDPKPIMTFVATLPPGTIVVHGGQVSVDKDTGELYGADYLAGRAAELHDLQVEVHAADWRKHGRAAGPIRNQEMADSKPDRAHGFRMPGESRGTDDMTRRLVAAGIPYEVTIHEEALSMEQTWIS